MSSPLGGSSSRSVCLRHVIDSNLRRDLGISLTSRRCSFCGQADLSAPIAVDFDRLARSVMAGVCEKYERLHPAEQGIPTHVVVDDVCSGALDPYVAHAVREWAQPASWRLRASLQPKEQRPAVESWTAFRERVTHQRRFTLLTGVDRHGPSHLAMLDKVSAVIELLGLVRTLPAGHYVWRGRMRGDAAAPGYVAATIGSTPQNRATANRMSPAGVSMFYGSADVETAVAEISAHDPRPYAAVAAFEVIRPINVIDLSGISAAPHVLAPDDGNLLQQIEFIRSFAADLSEPVALDGREHTAYVPTQVLTEYFRWLSPLCVEGIVFRSAQNGGVNYALFTGPEGCVDARVDKSGAVLRLQPRTEVVVARTSGDGRSAAPE